MMMEVVVVRLPLSFEGRGKAVVLSELTHETRLVRGTLAYCWRELWVCMLRTQACVGAALREYNQDM